ncbi:MAG: hypothetical protein HQL32_07950 [Planctomycetes bacterium]|nr:hypothetical protein [Planctomycetota bacterium]
MSTRFTFLIIFFLHTSLCLAWTQEPVSNNTPLLIISNSLKLKSLSRKDIINLFLAKSKKAHNTRVTAFLRTPYDSSLNNLFLKDYLKMSQRKFEKYWFTESVKGGAEELEGIESIEQLLNLSKKSKNLITYISSSEFDLIPNDIKELYSIISVN